jgi:hypothetical protein
MTSDTSDVYSIGRFAGYANFLVLSSWGFATLHPRLYAVGRFAGYANFLVLRSWGSAALHPRLMLSPAPQTGTQYRSLKICSIECRLFVQSPSELFHFSVHPKSSCRRIFAAIKVDIAPVQEWQESASILFLTQVRCNFEQCGRRERRRSHSWNYSCPPVHH